MKEKRLRCRKRGPGNGTYGFQACRPRDFVCFELTLVVFLFLLYWVSGILEMGYFGMAYRRSQSMVTDSTATSAHEDGSPATSAASSSKQKGKGKGKEHPKLVIRRLCLFPLKLTKSPRRRKVSRSDDDSDGDIHDNHVTPAPTRMLPKRAA